MKELIKLLWYLMFPKWKIYKVFNRKWEISDRNNLNITWPESCTYEIYYSERLDTYELRISGYEPKKHPDYPSIVDYFIKLHK